ncbi:hypothetical protein PISMIDRAFT_670511 [Pisolithus microcarpus 441]|uniref:Uncharacterized protein n=1 Tax=Pisolithus microcarpus 441 TaxID=765257 RepID=A0A0C9ZWU8_9AGAM|nr:hypothetical protein PISMIDRAFT_670511 [Pisolithus microcarpus 441]
MIATDLNRVKSRTNHFYDDIQQTRVRPQAPYHDPILRLRRTSTCQLLPKFQHLEHQIL